MATINKIKTAYFSMLVPKAYLHNPAFLIVTTIYFSFDPKTYMRRYPACFTLFANQ